MLSKVTADWFTDVNGGRLEEVQRCRAWRRGQEKGSGMVIIISLSSFLLPSSVSLFLLSLSLSFSHSLSYALIFSLSSASLFLSLPYFSLLRGQISSLRVLKMYNLSSYQQSFKEKTYILNLSTCLQSTCIPFLMIFLLLSSCSFDYVLDRT